MTLSYLLRGVPMALRATKAHEDAKRRIATAFRHRAVTARERLPVEPNRVFNGEAL